jgi:predicted nucleic acid-binding protein
VNGTEGYKIPADILPAIRQLTRLLPDLRQLVGTAPQVHLIVDTNVLVEDLRFLAKKRRALSARTAVQELLASETVVGYYPAEALSELEAKLDEIALRDAISRADLSRIWEEYRRALHICPAGRIPHATPDCLQLRDPTDLPFLALRHMVGAGAILTKDPDVSAAGTPVVPPIAVRIDLRDWARAKGMHLGVVVGETMIVGIPILAAVALLQGIGGTVAKLPPWLQVLLTVGVIAAIVHPRSRAAIGEAALSLGRQLSRAWADMEPLISRMIAEATDAEAEARRLWAGLEPNLPASPVMPTLAQAAYRACVMARQPLGTREIMAVLQMSGFPAGSVTPAGVEDVLRRNENVVMTTAGKWTVPLPVGPTVPSSRRRYRVCPTVARRRRG